MFRRRRWLFSAEASFWRVPHRLLLKVVCFFSILTITSSAQTLSTLGLPSTDRVAVSHNSWQATSIVLAETSPARRVQSVTLRMAHDVPNKNFTVKIVGSTSLRPDLSNVAATFGIPSSAITGTQPTSSNVVFTATESPAPLLQPGQTYWIVVGVTAHDLDFDPSSGRYFWNFANSPGQDPGAPTGLSVGAYVSSSGTAGTGWNSEQATPFSFSLASTAEGGGMTLTQWRTAHPGGPANNAAFLTSDTDGDGLEGLLEFAFDLDPSKSDAHSDALLDLQYDRTNERPVLTYKRWPNAPEIRYSLQWSSDMVQWTEANVSEIQEIVTPPVSANKPESVQAIVRRPSWPSRYFFRVNVSAN